MPTGIELTGSGTPPVGDADEALEEKEGGD